MDHTPRNRAIIPKIQDTRNYTLQGAGTGWSIWQLYKGCIGGTMRRLKAQETTVLPDVNWGRWRNTVVKARRTTKRRWQLQRFAISVVTYMANELKIQIWDVFAQEKMKYDWHPEGYLIYPWVGRCGPAPQTLTLFETKIVRYLISCLRHFTQNHTLFQFLVKENNTLTGRTSPLRTYKGVLPGGLKLLDRGLLILCSWFLLSRHEKEIYIIHRKVVLLTTKRTVKRTILLRMKKMKALDFQHHWCYLVIRSDKGATVSQHCCIVSWNPLLRAYCHLHEQHVAQENSVLRMRHRFTRSRLEFYLLKQQALLLVLPLTPQLPGDFSQPVAATR